MLQRTAIAALILAAACAASKAAFPMSAEGLACDCGDAKGFCMSNYPFSVSVVVTNGAINAGGNPFTFNLVTNLLSTCPSNFWTISIGHQTHVATDGTTNYYADSAGGYSPNYYQYPIYVSNAVPGNPMTWSLSAQVACTSSWSCAFIVIQGVISNQWLPRDVSMLNGTYYYAFTNLDFVGFPYGGHWLKLGTDPAASLQPNIDHYIGGFAGSTWGLYDGSIALTYPSTSASNPTLDYPAWGESHPMYPFNDSNDSHIDGTITFYITNHIGHP